MAMGIVFDECTFGYHAKHLVFDRFDLTLDGGRTVLLGPNGAGKSTLLGLAASVYRPRRGVIRLGELSSVGRRDRTSYLRQVGWLPQSVAPIPGMRVREQVAYTAWLKGMSRVRAWERALAALGQVDLTALAGKPVSSLSGGQLRRVGIAQALVHDPRVILMDEPTAGLDPRQRKRFREILTRLPETVDVVVSTHQTEDLDESYSHIVILDHATIRFQGTISQFLALGAASATPTERVETAYLRFVGAEA